MIKWCIQFFTEYQIDTFVNFNIQAFSVNLLNLKAYYSSCVLGVLSSHSTSNLPLHLKAITVPKHQ